MITAPRGQEERCKFHDDSFCGRFATGVRQLEVACRLSAPHPARRHGKLRKLERVRLFRFSMNAVPRSEALWEHRALELLSYDIVGSDGPQPAVCG